MKTLQFSFLLLTLSLGLELSIFQAEINHSKSLTIPTAMLKNEHKHIPKTTERIRLLRNATLVVDFGGKKLLIDPMFADKGEFPAFSGAGNDFRNPMVELPIGADELKTLVSETDAVFITHTHLDHWDTKAQQMIAKDTPIFVQPEDKNLIEEQGFTNVTAINERLVWEGIKVHRTGGQHGFGKVGKMMGKVSGFVFEHAEKKLYVADLKQALSEEGNAALIEIPEDGDTYIIE